MTPCIEKDCRRSDGIGGGLVFDSLLCCIRWCFSWLKIYSNIQNYLVDLDWETIIFDSVFIFVFCVIFFHGRTNYSLVIICLPFWEAEACIYWKMERYIVGGWSFIFFVLHAQSWNIVFYANLLQQTLSCELLWKKVQSHRLADWSYCWKQTELTPSCRNIFGEGDDRQDEYRIVVFIGTGFIVRCRLKAGCVLAPFVSLGSSKACSYKDLSLRFHRDCHSF